MTPLRTPIRTIVPNTTPAYLLRVYLDTEEQLPIIAWRIECEELRTTKPPHVVVDWTAVHPVSFEDCASNGIEFVVCCGVWRIPEDAQFDSKEEAVAYARADLSAREPR